ncbi:MAG: hypothetical protein KGL39_17685 [Patescibacteria group bacterium]|nr:hypothetical protein [Patescibacteria group bacterium]
MKFFPTTTDLTEWLQLPTEVQVDITAWTEELSAVGSPVTASLRAIAGRMGCSFQTARNKYYRWLGQGRDWRALKNLSKLPETAGVSPEFAEWWKQLCQQEGRVFKSAYKEFLRRFKAGEMIPGLPPATERHRLPRGFSYDNLIRYRPTEFETAAARRGRFAASDFRPKVLTSRVGLEVGQRYVFDDMWHDFEIVTLGRVRSRLLQLHAHDLSAACQFARGLKARLPNPETGKSMGLTQDEMLFLLAYCLGEFGYHPAGLVLMLEHGTANISEALEKLLFEISGKKITVERGGITGEAAWAGQYPGRGRGNFRFKASLESLGNLIHNETSNLLSFPGQTGSNSRVNAPEELAGRQKLADTLLLAMSALPAHVITQLRTPFLEVNTAKWLVNEVMERINKRTEHDLEGWVEMGRTCVDLELPGIGLLPAASYLALSPEKRAAVDAVAAPAPRKLSPREVFDAGAKQLVKFRPEQTALLLKQTHGREVAVGNDHLITFEDQDISPEPLHYLAHHFAPGDKFEAVVNPWSPDSLHLFSAAGAWIGQVRLWQRVPQTDAAALHRQMGAAAKVERQLLAPVAARGAELTKARLAATQQNIATLRRPPLTDEQKAEAAFVAAEGQAAAQDILASASPEPLAESGIPTNSNAGEDLLAALCGEPKAET